MKCSLRWNAAQIFHFQIYLPWSKMSYCETCLCPCYSQFYCFPFTLSLPSFSFPAFFPPSLYRQLHRLAFLEQRKVNQPQLCLMLCKERVVCYSVCIHLYMYANFSDCDWQYWEHVTETTDTISPSLYLSVCPSDLASTKHLQVLLAKACLLSLSTVFSAL